MSAQKKTWKIPKVHAIREMILRILGVRQKTKVHRHSTTAQSDTVILGGPSAKVDDDWEKNGLLGDPKESVPEWMPCVIELISPYILSDRHKRKHPRPVYDFENRKLRPRCYRASELPMVVYLSIKRYKPTASAQIELARLPRDPKSDRDAISQINQYMRFFDDWFFGSTLMKKLEGVQFQRSMYPRSYGYCHTRPLKVFLEGGCHDPDMERIVSFIDTILHEMIHAFVDLHVCEKPCCRAAYSAIQGGPGKNGHGPVFQNIQQLVLTALRNTVPWWSSATDKRSTARHLKLAMEYEPWVPTSDQLSFWSMKWDKVRGFDVMRDFYGSL
ncbi:hypothetical protein HYFRA_00013839 [Hymenoscyphus fraxineus]|uniref:SprT-like domain-containing protein n=1 Tax=Hymenoscyphus fraxineus TaxID=746836 RepID=A0A9N9PP13_9HELO|nr:hypothetical protein HYFRA_00013839 [Hymenoscyphus fraxineus]